MSGPGYSSPLCLAPKPLCAACPHPDLTLFCLPSQETEKIIAELNETWEEKLRRTEAIRMERWVVGLGPGHVMERWELRAGTRPSDAEVGAAGWDQAT